MPIGTYSIAVVDNIVLSGTSTTTLTFAIEVAGSKGFLFEEPHQGPYIVDPAYDARSLDTSYGVGQVEPQSGGLVNVSDPTEKCVGEHVKSVKQLLSRDEWTKLSTYKAYKQKGSQVKGVDMTHWFNPPLCCGTIQQEPGLWKIAGTYQMSTHNLIIYAYLFARGGTCFDIMGDTLSLANYGEYTIPLQNAQNQVASQMWESTGVMRIKAPYYNNTPKTYTIPSYDDLTVAQTGIRRVSSGYANTNRRLRYYGQNLDTRIGKRAADDAQLGFFLCAPPMMYVGNGPVFTTNHLLEGPVDLKTYYSDLV